MIKVGSDFSGVGAFNQALNRLGIEYKEVFACDMDKFARQTFIHNYGEPEYYPTNVYDREIPKDSLDIYMTSPPCQAFSLAGKRLGKDDKRGILFFNSYEFIQVNKPRFFIFENVKGLLSDDNGNTFSEWVNMLGGKSVNGVPVLFPYEESVPYHLYWKVLNAKEHGIPQNRERVFLVGIRDDKDNYFQFPREEHLIKRLKDVLEDDVDAKYFLSEKMIDCLQNYESDKFQVNTEMINNTDLARSLRAEMAKMGRQDNYLKIKSATSKGVIPLNPSLINNEQKAIILDCYNNTIKKDGISGTITQHCSRNGMTNGMKVIQLNPSLESGGKQTYQQIWIADYRYDDGLRIRKDNISPCMYSTMGSETSISQMSPIIGYNDKKLNDTIAKNILKEGEIKILDTHNRKVQDNAPTLTEPHHNTTRLWDGYKIRRLTPRECFRLMDFPDTFTWVCSDSQAYKQAGNSIVVNVLYKILKNLPL